MGARSSDHPPSQVTALLLLLGVVIANFALQPLTEPDFGWHLRTGLDLLDQGGFLRPSIPIPHTMGDWAWVEHAWLTDVIIGIVYSFAGGLGVILFFGAITAAAWVLAASQASSGPVSRSCACVISLWTALAYLGARTQLISLLGLALLLHAVRQPQGSGYKWIPFLFLIWGNLHGGFLAGLFLLGLILAASLLLRWVIARIPAIGSSLDEAVLSGENLIRLSVVLGFSTLITLVNPYGWRLHGEIFDSLSDRFMIATLQEWHPLMIETVAGRSYLVYLCGLGAGMLVWYRRIEPVRWVVLAVFLVLSLRHMRNIPIFLILSLPLCAELLAHGTDRLAKLFHMTNKRLVAAGTAATGLVLLWLGPEHVHHVVESGMHPARYFHKTSYPIEAIAWIQSNRHRLGRRLFNDYAYGGFLLWWLPDEKIFIDGRMPAWRAGDRRIFQDYMALTASTPIDLSVLSKYAIDWTLIRRHSPLDEALEHDPGWSRIYQDEKASIYARTPA